MRKGCSLILALILVLTSIVSVSALELQKKTDVDLDKVWKVKFSKDLDGDTIKPENIFIKDSEGNKIDIITDLDNNGQDVFLVPKQNYEAGESYRIHITDNVKSSDGKFLGEAVEMEFTTVSVNRSPVVVKEIENQIAKVGEVVSIDLREIFFDEDGDSLIYETTKGNVYGNTFRYTVENLTAPLYIMIGATDGEDIVYATFSVIVDKQIVFEDSKLEKAVREAANKPSGDLYSEDVKNITELDVNNEDISSLEGLQYLTGLKELKAGLNDIEDITPLRNLVNLESLDLKYNDIDDIDALEGLTNLENLELAENDIEDVMPLENLINLKELDLKNNNIEDVSPLSNLINLKVIEIDGNPIEDISPIEHLL